VKYNDSLNLCEYCLNKHMLIRHKIRLLIIVSSSKLNTYVLHDLLLSKHFCPTKEVYTCSILVIIMYNQNHALFDFFKTKVLNDVFLFSNTSNYLFVYHDHTEA